MKPPLLLTITILTLLTLTHASNTTTCTFNKAELSPNHKLIKTESAYGVMYEVYPSDYNLCNSTWLTPLGTNLSDPSGRAVIYLLALLYCFLGVAIIADVFMSAIEHITSKTKTIVRQDEEGNQYTATVLVWNATVANLTLMALGSSAPEILLAVIETVSNLGKPAGELGPGTIVGSAAFNLLVIIAICVYAIPDGETRRIKDFGVFIITASFSVFAYIWLVIVLMVWTPNEVTLEEALITLAFFPVLVFLAYCQDRSWFKDKSSSVNPGSEDDITQTTENKPPEHILNVNWRTVGGEGEIISKEQLGSIVRQLQKTNQIEDPADKDASSKIADALFESEKHHSVAMYRANAIRSITGQRRVLASKTSDTVREQAKRIHLHSVHNIGGDQDITQEETANQINEVEGTLTFLRANHSLYENEGPVELVVARHGGSKGQVLVDYFTEDVSAVAGEDYIAQEGTLVFKDGEVQKSILIDIIDNDVFEEDDTFMVYLANPQGGANIGGNMATSVIILNDDADPVVEFTKSVINVYEEETEVEITVRLVGATDLQTFVDYQTMEGNAKDGVHYEPAKGTLVFPSRGEIEQTIKIKVHNDLQNGRDDRFRVELMNPKNAHLGDRNLCHIVLVSDEGFSKLLDSMLLDIKARGSKLMLSRSWGDQFKDAMSIGADVDEHGNVLEPSVGDYIMHALTFPWKVLFATVPPTDIGGGWLTFIVSLLYIGAVTAVVGELASLFGCTIGIEDSITAITFVALGTSLPDTFASKTAAINEETADSSVGNVTGSNSVNVFLGLGLPWTIATIYHAIIGTPFIVPGGSLGFSVTIFTICALICLAFLVIRRSPSVANGELGGPKGSKTGTAILFVCLWLTYIILSSLQIKGIIKF